jgi:hypothetical protein
MRYFVPFRCRSEVLLPRSERYENFIPRVHSCASRLGERPVPHCDRVRNHSLAFRTPGSGKKKEMPLDACSMVGARSPVLPRHILVSIVCGRACRVTHVDTRQKLGIHPSCSGPVLAFTCHSRRQFFYGPASVSKKKWTKTSKFPYCGSAGDMDKSGSWACDLLATRFLVTWIGIWGNSFRQMNATAPLWSGVGG